MLTKNFFYLREKLQKLLKSNLWRHEQRNFLTKIKSQRQRENDCPTFFSQIILWFKISRASSENMNFFASFIIRSRHVTSFILFDIPLVPQISFKFVSQSYLALRHFQEKIFLLVMLGKKFLLLRFKSDFGTERNL